MQTSDDEGALLTWRHTLARVHARVFQLCLVKRTYDAWRGANEEARTNEVSTREADPKDTTKPDPAPNSHPMDTDPDCSVDLVDSDCDRSSARSSVLDLLLYLQALSALLFECPLTVDKLAPAPACVSIVTATTSGPVFSDGPSRAVCAFGAQLAEAPRAMINSLFIDERRPEVAARCRDTRINLDFLRLYALDRRARDGALLVDAGKVAPPLKRFHRQHNIYLLSHLLRDKLWDRVVLPPRPDPCPQRGLASLRLPAQLRRRGDTPARWCS